MTPDQILERKSQLKAEYDQLFDKIRACIKKSPEHFRLLREERVIWRKSVKLTEDFKYFFAKRREQFRSHIEEQMAIQSNLKRNSQAEDLTTTTQTVLVRNAGGHSFNEKSF